MSKSRDLINVTLLLALGKGSAQAVTFILLPFLTSHLATSEYGIYEIVLTYAALLAPALSVQLEMAAFRFLVDARGKFEAVRKTISGIFGFHLIVLTSMLIVAVALYLSPLPPYYFWTVMLTIGVMSSSLTLQIARGLGRNISYAIGSITLATLNLVLVIWSITIIQSGLVGILQSTTYAHIITTLFMLVLLRREILVRPTFKRDSYIGFLKYSWPLVPNGMSAWVLNLSDRTIILIFLSASSAGLYAAGSKIASIITAIFSVYYMAWTETVALHLKDPASHHFLKSTYRNSVNAFISISVMLVAITPFLFNLLIDAKFSEAYNYIPLLATASFFSCVSMLLGSVYIATKETVRVASTTVVAAFSSAAIGIALVIWMGEYGVMIAGNIAYFSLAFYRRKDVSRHIELCLPPIDKLFGLISYTLIVFCYFYQGYLATYIGLLIALLHVIYTGCGMMKAARKD